MPNSTAIEFLTLAQVELRVALKKTAIYRAMRRNAFPRPAKLTEKAVRWHAAEIDEWQRARLAERDRAA